MKNHVQQMAKEFETMRYRHGISNLFEDFLELIAITISNSADRAQFEKREARYMQIIGKYSREEANTFFPKVFAMLILALEDRPDDYLGQLFMELELYDSWKGQFFTSYDVAAIMARMTLDDNLEKIINEKGYVTANDPAVGGGVTLITLFNEIKRLDYNPQQAMRVVAQDIDKKAVHMTYIQLSLLGVNAQIYHSNTLTLETWGVWRSPGYFLFAGRGIGVKKPAEMVEVPEIGVIEELPVFEKVEQLTLF